MSWHVRDITRTCDKSYCGSRATCALYDRRNTLHGYYCRKCGQQEVKRRIREDKKRAADLEARGISFDG